jgi:hypothetical protein
MLLCITFTFAAYAETKRARIYYKTDETHFTDYSDADLSP